LEAATLKRILISQEVFKVEHFLLSEQKSTLKLDIINSYGAKKLKKKILSMVSFGLVLGQVLLELLIASKVRLNFSPFQF
jgi:hypothetical protein